jgi:hypothetical protein
MAGAVLEWEPLGGRRVKGKHGGMLNLMYLLYSMHESSILYNTIKII